MSRPLVHVVLPSTSAGHEFAACGYAFDQGSEDANAEGTFEDARPGLRVTCPLCCAVVMALRHELRGLRLAPRERPAEDW